MRAVEASFAGAAADHPAKHSGKEIKLPSNVSDEALEFPCRIVITKPEQAYSVGVSTAFLKSDSRESNSWIYAILFSDCVIYWCPSRAEVTPRPRPLKAQ